MTTVTRNLIIITGALLIVVAHVALVVVLVARGLWRDWREGRVRGRR